MKNLILAGVFFLMSWTVTFAQKTITGTVTAAEDNSQLPGVTVLVKGTTKGTQTDFEGKYKLEIPEGSTQIEFRYVGYKTQTVDVASQSTIDIIMETDDKVMSEIVVTALGFKEERDKLGATYSKVNTEAIGRSGETGIITALSGKAAGVQITRNSGDPGAGAYIQIRGQSTLTGSLQPLVIIDGIPVSNSTIGTSENQVDGPVQQSRMNDINPDDIETLQVLKGPSAAALWGTRAANGVIVITTKKGKNNDKINISFRSSYSIDKINRKHKLQTSYGQGTKGVFIEGALRSWGDKISDRSGAADDVDKSGYMFLSESGKKYYGIIEKNSKNTYVDSNFDQVYQTGSFWDNSVSFSGGDAKNAFMVSIGDLNQKGIMRNNSDYRRTSIRFNNSRTFNKFFSVNTTAAFVRTASNRMQMGSNVAGLMLGLLRTPPDFDNSDYAGSFFENENSAPITDTHRSYISPLGGYIDEETESFDGDPFFNNPGWTVNKQRNTSMVNRFIGSLEMIGNPTEWLSLIARAGIDSYSDRRTTYFPKYSGGFAPGYFEMNTYYESQFNTDLMARFTKDFTEDLSFTGIVGFNYNSRIYNELSASNQAFILPAAPEVFSNGEAANTIPVNYKRDVRTAASYLSLNLGYMDMLYLDVTARAEAASTFGPKSDRQFYYPSTSLAWQFSQLEALKGNEIITFGKLRAAWGIVGIQPAAYRVTTPYYGASYTESWGPYLDAAFYGGSYNRGSNGGNPFLKPERKSEFEFGTDLRFFDNKLSLGVTYFSNKTTDILLPVAIGASTGFTSTYGNAASVENKGMEIELNYKVIQTDDLTVSLTGNWTRYRNKVTSLSGTESLLLNGFTGTSSRAVEGQPLGVLWGTRWKRDESGALVLNANGFPTLAPTEGVIGNPNPDWRAGFGGEVTYKGISLSFLFERQQGGQMWNGTLGALYSYGTSADVGVESVASVDLTEANGNKIPAGQTFRGTIKDFGAGPVALTQAWYQAGLGSGFNGPGEQFVFDASWTRLREVTLSYSLPQSVCKKAKLQAIDVSISGRNLMLWTNWKGIDPETNLTGASNGRGLEYFNNPNTRSYLFTLKVTY